MQINLALCTLNGFTFFTDEFRRMYIFAHFRTVGRRSFITLVVDFLQCLSPTIAQGERPLPHTTPSSSCYFAWLSKYVSSATQRDTGFATTNLVSWSTWVPWRSCSDAFNLLNSWRNPSRRIHDVAWSGLYYMVIWFYSSSRFGDCSYYNFLLSENNSMATHKSGLQVFSSGQASTWTRSSYSMSVCVICLLAHERSAIFSHGGMIRTW